LAKRTRFFQKKLTSGKYIKVVQSKNDKGTIDNVIVPDEEALDRDVDGYFNKILPIVAGLAKNTDELEDLSTDQYQMLSKLSVKVLDMQQQNMASAIVKGLGLDQETGDDAPNDEEVLQLMKEAQSKGG